MNHLSFRQPVSVFLALVLSLALVLTTAQTIAAQSVPDITEILSHLEALHNQGDREAELALAQSLPEPHRSRYLDDLAAPLPPEPKGGGPYIGINGAACNYSDMTSALAAAPDGATIYINLDYYGRVGQINKNLTFTASTNNCTTASAGPIIIDANDAEASYGGVAEITTNKTVTFRNLILTDGTAMFGGILYGNVGSTINLDNTDLTYGMVTAGYGGGMRLNSATANLTNGSSIYANTTAITSHGAGAAIDHGTLNLYDTSQIGYYTDPNHGLADGGGVYLVTAILNLNDQSTILGNYADGNGGGVYARDGSVINLYDSSGIGFMPPEKADFGLEKALVYYNTAYDGGGIYLTGAGTQLNMSENSTVYNNMAYHDGGGIYASGASQVLIDSASINQNHAVNRGGGLLVSDDVSVDIQNGSYIINNTCDSQGGGISIPGTAVVNINQSTFNNNRAGAYGAIHLLNFSTLNITNSTLTYNDATSGDGGALGFSFSTATITTSVLQHNEAARDGGAIYASNGKLKIIDSDIRWNTAVRNGGGIFNDGQLDFWAVDQDSFLAVNQAANGGGIYALGNDMIYFRAIDTKKINLNTNIALSGSGGGIFATGTVYTDIFGNVQMTSNTAFTHGGAIYQHGGSLILDDYQRTHVPQIWVNTAYHGNGGGIYVINPDYAYFYGIQLGGNTNGNNAPEGYGGGIYLSGNKSATILNITAQNNSSGLSGGAIAAVGGFSVNIRSSFGDPAIKADNRLEGGPSSFCNPSLLAANRYCSEFRFNSAGVDDNGYGGAVFVDDNSGAFIRQTSFHGNTGDWGGAIEVYYGIADVKNSLFTANDGGVNDSTVHVFNVDALSETGRFNCELCTFADNPSYPIYYGAGSEGDLMKSIVWDNDKNLYYTAGDPFFFCVDYEGSVLPGSMNISLNPQFTTTSRGSYRLGSGSPAIDACTTGSGPDLDGVDRPIGGIDKYDMGAFEAPTKIYLPVISR